jgi:hypothetical protein
MTVRIRVFSHRIKPTKSELFLKFLINLISIPYENMICSHISGFGLKTKVDFSFELTIISYMRLKESLLKSPYKSRCDDYLQNRPIFSKS